MENTFFKHNREKLLEKIEDNSLVIMLAGQAPRKSADENYPFTPNRNFYYLTGIDEEKDVLIMVKSSKLLRNLEELYISPFDPVMSKWVGRTYSEEEAYKMSGIASINKIQDYKDQISTYISRLGIKNIYLDLEKQGYDEITTYPIELAKELRNKYPGIVIKDVYDLIAELRMVKQDCEIEEIRKAIHITNLGLKDVLNHIQGATNEAQLSNIFTHTIFDNFASDFAFETICAAHKNSTTLHYHANNSPIIKDCVVLFDLGAEYNYYKADISRTYPHSGKYSRKQKEIYQIVLNAQKLVIDNAKPGLTIRDLNNMVIEYYGNVLLEKGYIKDKKEVSNYYFHSVSHHLGLDTHDVTVGGKKLEKGNVITVEPGLYFEELNIGVRIEDDILITEDGCEVLSKEIIKEVKDIEDYLK